MIDLFIKVYPKQCASLHVGIGKSIMTTEALQNIHEKMQVDDLDYLLNILRKSGSMLNDNDDIFHRFVFNYANYITKLSETMLEERLVVIAEYGATHSGYGYTCSKMASNAIQESTDFKKTYFEKLNKFIEMFFEKRG
jgi:hypothetical protein